jgi:ankyrin repeat protein
VQSTDTTLPKDNGETAKALLDNGANPWDRATDNKCALNAALRSGNQPLAQILVNSMCEKMREGR